MSPVELKDKKPFSGLIFLYLFRFGQLHIEDQRLRLAAVQNSFILQIQDKDLFNIKGLQHLKRLELELKSHYKRSLDLSTDGHQLSQDLLL